MARPRKTGDLTDAQIDALIPEVHESEADEWKRAFRYAYRKGNRFTEADITMLERDPDVVRSGHIPNVGDPTKACVVFANSHAPDFEDGPDPVPRQD